MPITERHETVTLHGGNENLSIFHISDIHLWCSTGILDKLKTLISNANPDLIIATGDYYDLPKGAKNFRNFLTEICKTHTVVLIKGNHDNMYGSKISNLLSGIENCFLVETSIYRYQSKKGYIYTITSWKHKNNLPNNTGEKNIVLIHNPEKIKTEELTGIDLILAGHLHGGQIILCRTKNNSYFPGCMFYNYCTDRKQIGDTTLIVSKGLGDMFPFRLNCPKEVVRINIE